MKITSINLSSNYIKNRTKEKNLNKSKSSDYNFDFKQNQNMTYYYPINFGSKNNAQNLFDNFINTLKNEKPEQYAKIENLKKLGFSFNLAYKLSSKDDDTIKLATELLQMNVPCTDITYIFTSCPDISQQRYVECIKEGMDFKKSFEICKKITSDEQFEFLKEQIKSGYDIKTKIKRNSLDTKFVAKKFIKAPENVNILFTKTLDKNGNKYFSRMQNIDGDWISTSYQQSNKEEEIFCDKTKVNGITSHQILKRIEINHNENNEPDNIVVTTPSELLPGAKEITKYKLSDYSEETDVLNEIKSNSLTGGEKLSFVTKTDDGTVKLEENYTYNNFTTNRKYSEKRDDNGNLKYTAYEYKITDENGTPILNLNRKWNKFTENKSETIINGNKIFADFDDNSNSVTISGVNGKILSFSLKNKLDVDNNEALWAYIKELPADLVLALNRPLIKNITLSKETDNGYIAYASGELLIPKNLHVTAHELGHCLDQSYLNKPLLSRSDKLYEIFTKESNDFFANNTEFIQEYIKYFSPWKEYSASEGFTEIIAEIYALLTTYGTDNSCSDRIHFVSKYFPQTIAEVAKQIGM